MKKAKPTRSPTLADVAREAGLSPMTVSRAINTPELVRDTTVEKVMQAVEKTGYIPNALAGSLASQRSRLIAVVVPQINNNMFVDSIQSLNDALAERGYHMLLCVAGYDQQTETEIVSTLLSRRPDGIVLTGIHHSSALKKIILNATIPVVEIWDLTPTPLDMLVGFSHEKVGITIGEFLLNKGYKRPGLLWAGDIRAKQRKQGIIDTLTKQGLETPTEINVPLPASLSGGRLGLNQLLSHGSYDVVICSSDTLAQGAIMEAENLGLNIPNDIAIIGFGDLAFAADNNPSITTIHVDRSAIGKQAAMLLTDRIENNEEGSSNSIIDIGYRLVERSSA